ncbi:glycosyltransferase [Sutcliffiella halmapala]|uniref:glycosyltransferase n=1 Tax=Sutcliffiella halmapala TaxID=79882 RepID=UPI000994F701|nr:glycosyltransferase [Sutcliffiella halmapala]
MKILYLSWFNSGEGSQVHAKEFIHAMEQLGHDIVPVELSLKSKKQLQNLKIQSSSISSQKPKFAFLKEFKTFLLNILRIIRLLKLYKEHKPDAIINRYLIYDFSAIIAGKILRIPVMYEVNASAVYERDIENKYYIKPLARFIEKLIFKKSDAVTVVSQELKDYFDRNDYHTKKTLVIPNGVDITRYPEFIETPDRFQPIASKWQDKTIIGFLGSLKSWHGVQRLITLLPSILQENKDIRLLIIGDGNEREAIEAEINALNIKEFVHISGFIPHKEVPGALNLLDITIAPYKNIENFYFSPLKIFEYMAAGKPVVAPPYGQIKELVTEDTGILLPNNSDQELKEAILELAANPNKRQELGRQARVHMENNYTWKINASKIAERLKEIQ